MESKLKSESQDAVGELPNLLLLEGGYPHLPTTPIKPKSDAWNDAGTKPSIAGVYQTRIDCLDMFPAFQMFNGDFWDYPAEDKDEALTPFGRSSNQNYQWREVQP